MVASGMLHLTVMTPEQLVLHVDAAQKVRLKLVDQAWLSIYPHHESLVAEILPGPLQYETAIETGEIMVGSGILQVDGDEIVILTSGLQHDDRPVTRNDVDHADLRFDRLAEQLMADLNGDATVAPDRGGRDSRES